MDDRIQVRDTWHDGSLERATNIARAQERNEEVPDSTALGIAASWQSPGSVGHVLASLACGAPVELDDLLADIGNVRQDIGWNDLYRESKHLELDMLATWAIQKAKHGDQRKDG